MTGARSPRLCLVTDRRRLPGAATASGAVMALEAQCAEAIDAGIDIIQVREPDLDARTLEAFVHRVIARASGSRTAVFVNDRADIAALTHAGLHLKSDGPPVSKVRGLFSSEVMIGRSIHVAGEIEPGDPADFYQFGTVFPSRSKPIDAPIAGSEGLHAAVRATDRPVLAIGGVTPANARECRAAGAAGIAAIELFLPAGASPHALGPAAAARALREAWG